MAATHSYLATLAGDKPESPVVRNIVGGHVKGPRPQKVIRTGLQNSREERRNGSSWAFPTGAPVEALGRRALMEGGARRGCHAAHNPVCHSNLLLGP